MSTLVQRSLAVVLFLTATTAPAANRAGQTEVLATFTVHAGASDRVDTPVSASLDGLVLDPASRVLKLHEVVRDQRLPTPSQVAGELRPPPLVDPERSDSGCVSPHVRAGRTAADRGKRAVEGGGHGGERR